MIMAYIRERLSWILLFVFLQLMLLFIAAVDAQIPFLPILYIVFLSTLFFLVFLFVRYNRETKFYKSLQAWDDTYDLAAISEPERPFEGIAMDMLSLQTERFKKESSMRLMEMQGEKDELLSWIHEVKTPLTTMQLMIERMEDETLKAQLQYEWLRIHLLLDQQLHQKRIPFIQNDLLIEVSALEPIIFQEIRGLKTWCMQKGIGFDVSLQAAEVLSDAKWLGFIIRQLLTNAVKYSSASDINIESDLVAKHVRLIIRDAGRGIDPKDMPRIFDKGFTSTTSHQDRAATGMGLYLTKKVAEALMIRIQVESKPGIGTTFTLIFPKRNDFVSITGM
ncbi:sensor histidine kinase [Paenibacillus sp. Y412MC10]|uniref:sensor histidine kinase n=1 Tax=Geobacillus sp. (strain Y412MC10) TaxID=481743 RepID=UPI000178905A|nr:sensor histidine kinase [Paenibacillus sp. Y412MC10]ACX68370.1 integral membrane sensor signal transduction histidine kinase [Paenibacillus sp. Y412MC10]